MLIKNGMIHDAIQEEPYIADILIRDGKIQEIAAGLAPQADEEIIDVKGLSVYPGFVDAHSHLGLDPYAQSGDKDYNEMSEPITPQLRGIDSFNPFDAAIRMALEGGVTTVGTGPGSANILGGTFFAVKTYGTCVDDMAVKNPVAMKAAFGENPKRCYDKKGCSVRMTVAAKLREELFLAREYDEKLKAAGDDPSKKPKFDMKLEAMLPVIRKELPLKVHAHRADDICTVLRIAKEFDLKVTLEHCTDGALIVDELVRAGYPVAVGPSLGNATKVELVRKSFKTPGILAKAGLQVSIITDAPVIPQQYLPLCAGYAVKEGMDPFAALQAITINPAKHLGIEDRVGSLEVGKDADVVITDGDPMINLTNVVKVIVDGKCLVDNA